jgi:hypothetical protein
MTPIKASERMPTAADADSLGRVMIWDGKVWQWVNLDEVPPSHYWLPMPPPPISEAEQAYVVFAERTRNQVVSAKDSFIAGWNAKA